MSKSSSGTQKSSSPRSLLFFVPYFSACLGFSSPKLSAHGTPFTRTKKIGTARQIFGTVPRLPVPRLPPEGSLGTPKILSTGATLHLGPIRLHVEKWECRALKSSARCQTIWRAVPIFLARVNGVPWVSEDVSKSHISFSFLLIWN